MVNKKFRPLVCGLCISMSTLLAASGPVSAVLAEEQVEMQTETQTEKPVEAQTEAQTEKPVEAQTEAQTEKPVEAQTEAQTEKAAEVQPETQAETVQEDTTALETVTDSGATNQGTEAGDSADGNTASGGENAGDAGNGTESGGTEGTEKETDATEKKDEETAEEVSITLPEVTVSKSAEIGKDIEMEAKNTAVSGTEATVTVRIPEGAKVSEVKNGFAFEDADVEAVVIDSEGKEEALTTDSVKKDTLKEIVYKVKAKEGKTIGVQKDSFKMIFSVADAGQKTVAVTVKAGNKEQTRKTEFTVSAKKEAALAIVQNDEKPSAGTPFTENVNITFPEKQKNGWELTYTTDGNSYVKGIAVPSSFIGGTARITYADGDRIIDIGEETVSLDSFDKITKVVITPAAAPEAGDVSVAFVLSSVAENTSETVTTASTVIWDGSETKEFTQNHTTALSYCVVGKPEINHQSNMVAFGETVTIDMAGIRLDTNQSVEQYAYEIKLPTYMTLKKVKVPEITGVEAVDIYMYDEEGNGVLAATAAPGDVFDSNEKVSKLAFVAVNPTQNINVTRAGYVVLANDQQDNKTNYVPFQATATAVCDGESITNGSGVLGATLAIYKYEKPNDPQTGGSTNNGGGNSGGNGNSGNNGGGGSGNTETPSTEPETPSTEDNTEAEKEALAKKKTEEAAAALAQEEEKAAAAQKALLLARLKKVKSGVAAANADKDAGSTGTGAVSGATVSERKLSTKEKELKEEFGITPIDESMVDNLNRIDKRLVSEKQKELYSEKGIISVDERMVKNLSKNKEVQESM